MKHLILFQNESVDQLVLISLDLLKLARNYGRKTVSICLFEPNVSVAKLTISNDLLVQKNWTSIQTGLEMAVATVGLISSFE